MLVEIALIFVISLILCHSLRIPANTPPGYWGLPLFGYIPIFETNKLKILSEMRKYYGDVVSWRIGTRHLVFVFDYKLIKEALTGADFLDRPHFKIFSFMEPGEKVHGLVFSNGKHWHNLRRFSLRHLRELGMGKSRLLSAAQFEANELVKELQKQVGNPAPLPNSLAISILNIIWQMVAGTRNELIDKEFLEFKELIDALQNSVKRLLIPDVFPWVTRILPRAVLSKLLRDEKRIRLSNKMEKYLMHIIDEHRKNLDVNDPKDYIDAYLVEMGNQKDDPACEMSIQDLLFCIGDLFATGSETTTITIEWSIFYLATYPTVQKKLQQEIDEVMPKGISASLEYKSRLPYTEAFIHEVLRHSNLLPIGFMHTNSKDTYIGGYRIPKDAILFGTSFLCHNDPKYFSSPKDFHPERFLSEDGKFVSPKEGFLPFGIGRRQCLGEALARMELFVFVTTLVQNFRFSTPPGETIDMTPVVNNPIINFPDLSQNIILEAR